jgi:hypothetical protein
MVPVENMAVDTKGPKDTFITRRSASPFTSYFGLWNITGAFTVDVVFGSTADVINRLPSTFLIVPVDTAGRAPIVTVEKTGSLMIGIS